VLLLVVQLVSRLLLLLLPLVVQLVSRMLLLLLLAVQLRVRYYGYFIAAAAISGA